MNRIDCYKANPYHFISMSGITKDLPTTALKTNPEYNATWNINDRSLGMLPKGGESLTKSCAAEHTASNQYRLSSVRNLWLTQSESNGIRDFFSSGQEGYRFSTGSIDTIQVCPSREVGLGANSCGVELKSSNVFFPNNTDRNRTSSVSDIQACQMSGQASLGESFPVTKRRKSSFQITSITVPDRSKLSAAESSEFLDSWDSVEDMLSNRDDISSDTHDGSQSTIDLNENGAMSFDTREVVTIGTESYGVAVFFPQTQNADMNMFTNDNASTNVTLAGDSSVFSALTSFLPRMDVLAEAQSCTPVVELPNLIVDVSKASESTVDNNSKPVLQINEIHSRFKIVKILNRIRGRWKCSDCIGLPMSIGECSSSKLSDVISVGGTHCAKGATCNPDSTPNIPFVCATDSHFVEHPTAPLFARSCDLSALHGIESRIQEGCEGMVANSDVSSGTMSYVVGLVPLSSGAVSSSPDHDPSKVNDMVIFLPQMCHNIDQMRNSPSVVKVSNFDSSAHLFERIDEKREEDTEEVIVNKCSVDIATPQDLEYVAKRYEAFFCSPARYSEQIFLL